MKSRQVNSKTIRRKSKQSINILGVDDEQICALFLEDVIKSISKNGKVVRSGKEAIEEIKLSKIKYHLVIADLNMPEINGYDVCREVKAFERQRERNIIVLAHTASTQSIITDKCKDAGFDGVLIKPVDTDKLKEVINSYA